MLSKNQLKFYKSLQQKKHRQATQLFVVEGEKPLLELMQARAWAVDFWGFTEAFIEKHYARLKETQLAYEVLTMDEVHQLSSLEYQKAGIAVVKMPPNIALKPLPASYTLALDNVQDPGNLGTLLRLADWYGFPQVVCSQDCVEVYNPKTILSSMGSFLRVKTYYTDLPAYLAEFRDLPTLGAFMDGKNIHTFDFPKAGILVLGNEGHGISEALLPLIDVPITIPRFGGAESLNVAMAGAVLLDRMAQVVHTKFV